MAACKPGDNDPAPPPPLPAFYNTVLTSDNSGHLFAFDATTGDEKWRFTSPNNMTFTPAFDGKTLYAGGWSGYKLYSYAYAIDAATGNEKWRLGGARENFYFASAPLLKDGTLYAAGAEFMGGINFQVSILAVDTATGAVKWVHHTGADNGTTSPITISGNLLYYGNGPFRTINALDLATGNKVWTTTLGHNTWTTPAVVNGLLYTGSEDGNMYAIDAYNGAVQWKYPTNGWVESAPVVAGNIVYFGSTDSSFHAVDIVTHLPRWTFKSRESLWGSPLIDDSTVYVTDNRNVYAISRQTGIQKWAVATSFNPSNPVLSEGRIYITNTGDGYLRVLNAATGAELWRKDFGGHIGAPPLVIDKQGSAHYAGDRGDVD